jgi:hypothetical protein
MMNSVEIANNLINRAKNLQEFEVRRLVDGPIMFDGVIPFNITLNEGCAWFQVLAVSQTEAETLVDEWMFRNT